MMPRQEERRKPPASDWGGASFLRGQCPVVQREAGDCPDESDSALPVVMWVQRMYEGGQI